MFCDKCGSILVPAEDGFSCPNCGTKGGDVDLSEGAGKGKDIFMVKEGDVETLPCIEITCKKCCNKKAYYFVYQTRSADEAPTTFYQCTKCGNKWREY